MAKRVFGMIMTDDWLKEKIKEWSKRSIELDNEIALLRFENQKWKDQYKKDNEHREDWETDDEWHETYLMFLRDLWHLDDEMSYLRLCIEDETEKCLL